VSPGTGLDNRQIKFITDFALPTITVGGIGSDKGEIIDGEEVVQVLRVRQDLRR
jgi:hypothetical protein